MEITKYIIDIETDGLLDEVSRVHCLSYCDTKSGIIGSLTNPQLIKQFFLQEDVVFIGHNIICYDVPVIEKLFNVEVKAKQYDTLALSWTLFPENDKHGLEQWGEFFGIKKPEIKDWNNLTIDDYVHRCQEDVKINYKLWLKQVDYLNILYRDNPEQAQKYIDYLSFKLQCVKEHQLLGVNFDKELCEKSLAELELLKETKITTLKNGMPKRPIKSIKTYPKRFYKEDGTISAIGEKWLEFLKSQNLPLDTKTEVEYISDWEEPNPNSHDQIKNWLYSLGWIPENIKHFRDKKKNEVRQIPQIKSKTEEGEICESIKKLFDKAPALEALDDLFIISHRISLFKGFLRDCRNNRLYQGIQGLTNTLRLQHSGIVNLPNISKPYSENVRKCLIADEGKLMLGSDLTGIEDNTKRHYIYKYDPAYVETMNNPNFDAHLDIAVLAGFLTSEQAENHKKGIENHKAIRQKAKTANFALTYKCGVATLARQTGLKEREAKKLADTYWKRNKAILDVENELKTKQIGNQKWILNPVSNFWYSLRAEKDKFSTLNQGTAVYCFDRFLYYVKNQGIKVNFQVHDEFTSNLLETEKELYTEKINKALENVNNELQLNVKIGCSIDFGTDYTECH